MKIKNLIYGLVVCGGKSSRMGTDKSLLDYHGQAQRYYLYNLLEQITDKVFISCNMEQAPGIPAEYEFIVDSEKFQDIGPMAAVLSGFDQYPDASFLVVGCDYPFIRKNDLKELAKVIAYTASGAAFYNESAMLYEPLLASYPNRSAPVLRHYFEQGEFSLNCFLKNVHANKLVPDSPEIIKSIDTLAEYREAVSSLKKSPNFPQI